MADYTLQINDDAVHERGYLTFEEAEGRLNVSRSQMYRYLNSGKLPSYSIGYRRCFREADIDAFADKQKERMTPRPVTPPQGAR